MGFQIAPEDDCGIGAVIDTGKALDVRICGGISISGVCISTSTVVGVSIACMLGVCASPGICVDGDSSIVVHEKPHFCLWYNNLIYGGKRPNGHSYHDLRMNFVRKK